MKRIFNHPLIKKLFPQNRLRIWIMLTGVIIALLCFEEIQDDVFDDPLEGDFESDSFDRAISQFVMGFRSPALTGIMTDMTALGSISVILTLFIIFVSVLASFRDFKGIAFISLLLLGAGLWPYSLKLYFARIRPIDSDWLVNVTTSSFPSGHSFGAAAAYVGFAYYASQYAKRWNHELFFFFLGGILALLVGSSRIYLGVHYPTDVLAGLSGGVAWALTAAALFEIFERPVIKKLGSP